MICPDSFPRRVVFFGFIYYMLLTHNPIQSSPTKMYMTASPKLSCKSKHVMYPLLTCVLILSFCTASPLLSHYPDLAIIPPLALLKFSGRR